MAKGSKRNASSRNRSTATRDTVRRDTRTDPTAGGHTFDVSRALDRLAEQLPEINRKPRTLVAPPAPAAPRPVIRATTKPVERVTTKRPEQARRVTQSTRSAVSDFQSRPRPNPSRPSVAAAARTAPARSTPSPVAAATRPQPTKRKALDNKKPIVRKCEKRPSDTRKSGGSRSFVPWDKKPC